MRLRKLEDERKPPFIPPFRLRDTPPRQAEGGHRNAGRKYCHSRDNGNLESFPFIREDLEWFQKSKKMNTKIQGDFVVFPGKDSILVKKKTFMTKMKIFY